MVLAVWKVLWSLVKMYPFLSTNHDIKNQYINLNKNKSILSYVESLYDVYFAFLQLQMMIYEGGLYSVRLIWTLDHDSTN